MSGFERARRPEVVLVHADDPRLQRMAVLDVLLNNADRKGRPHPGRSTVQVYGIDHGICLHPTTNCAPCCRGWAGSAVPGGLLADVDAFAQRLADPTGSWRPGCAG